MGQFDQAYEQARQRGELVKEGGGEMSLDEWAGQMFAPGIKSGTFKRDSDAWKTAAAALGVAREAERVTDEQVQLGKNARGRRSTMFAGILGGAGGTPSASRRSLLGV